MKKYFIIYIILACTLASLNGFAEEIIACGKECSSMDRKASNEARWMYNGKIFSVIDTYNFQVKSYKSVWKWRFGEEFFDKALPITTTYSGQRALKDLVDAKNALRLQKVQIPSDLPETSYDDKIESVYQLFTQPQLEGRISNYINQNLSAMETVGAYGSTILSIFGKVVDVNAEITIEFPDGSTASFTVKAIKDTDSGFEFAYLPETAIDNESTPIPEGSLDFLGNYTFENDLNANFQGVRRVAL